MMSTMTTKAANGAYFHHLLELYFADQLDNEGVSELRRMSGDINMPIVKHARGRDETEPCERGTVGCCVEHAAPGTPPPNGCETW